MIRFPPSWPVHDLGDLVDILDARRIPVSAKERADRRGNVPYYGATGQVGTIDGAIFDEPLVLLGEDGVQFFDPSKRKSYLIEGQAWVNNHAHVLRSHGTLDRRFLSHYLNAVDYRGFVNGTTRLKLTQAAMRRIPIPLPVLDEQRRIVDLLEDHLSRLDAAESSLQLAMRKADSMVTASLDRQTAPDHGAWRDMTIGETAELVEYGSSAKCGAQADDSDIPVLRMGNIQSGVINWNGLKFLPSDHQDFPKLLLKPGDLVFNRTNSAELVGKSAVFDSTRVASFASYLIRVRFDPNVDPKWANMVINSPGGRRYVKSVASQQVGQANVNGTKLKAFPLPLPPLEEQHGRIRAHEEVVASRERLRGQIGEAMIRTANLRRSLLAAAFSGRLTSSSNEMLEELESV